MNTRQKMKKLPLIIGAFLLIIWGASKKVIFQVEDTLCIEHNTKLYPSHLDRLDKLTCLANTSWEQFHRTARPLLPEIISDKELDFVYHFLQQPPKEGYFDEPAAQEDRLKVLLILSAIVNPE